MQLSDVDLVNPDNWVDGVPHEAFRVLREQAPVFWHDVPPADGQGFYAITKYEDLVTISKDPATYSSWRGSTMMRDLPQEDLQVLGVEALGVCAPVRGVGVAGDRRDIGRRCFGNSPYQFRSRKLVRGQRAHDGDATPVRGFNRER